MHHKSTAKILLLLSASALVACSSEQPQQAGPPPVHNGAESLLAAEGPLNLVEDSNAPTPEQEHMNARKQVDPARPAASHQYTKNITRGDMNEETHFRVLRLENEVAGLREDFNKLLPPLSDLILSDDKLDQTITEIEERQKKVAAAHQALYTGEAAPLPAMKPEAQAAAPKVVAQPAAPAGAPAVTGVRTGDYPGKTRLVLDLNTPSKFTYDIDNNEKLLIIDLAGAGWTAEAQKVFGNHPLIRGYTASPSANGGTTLAVELKQPAKIVASSALPPNDVYGSHRIFLDIAAL